MKTLRILILILAPLLMYTACDEDEIDYPVYDGYLIKPLIDGVALQGNLLDDPIARDVQVWLPTGYRYNVQNHNRKYPVLYLLHGIPLGAQSYTSKDGWDEMGQNWVGTVFQQNSDFPSEGFEDWMNAIMDDPEVEDMIIVTADASSSYGLTCYTDSPLHGNMEAFIAEDVVGFIDATYNTIASREGRYLSGHCLGGYGALRLAMKYPDVFGKVAAMSPFMMTPEMMEGIGQTIQLENPEGFQGPDPTKFFTSAMFGFGAGWSPNPNNPPYYIDLPVNLETGEANPAVVEKWTAENPFSMLVQYGDALRNLEAFYFDCGDKDELSTHLTNQAYHQVLNQAGIAHTFELYDGYHLGQVYQRLERVIRFLSGIDDAPTGN